MDQAQVQILVWSIIISTIPLHLVQCQAQEVTAS